MLYVLQESYKDRLAKRKKEKADQESMNWEAEQDKRLREKELASAEEVRKREEAATPRHSGIVGIGTPGFSSGRTPSHQRMKTPRRVGL